jgi:hypothetical protein
LYHGKPDTIIKLIFIDENQTDNPKGGLYRKIGTAVGLYTIKIKKRLIQQFIIRIYTFFACAKIKYNQMLADQEVRQPHKNFIDLRFAAGFFVGSKLLMIFHPSDN